LKGTEFGFPIDEKGRPTWHVVPEFLEVPLLHALLDELFKNPLAQTAIAVSDRAIRERILDELTKCYARRKT
jgi:hypothetical protein